MAAEILEQRDSRSIVRTICSHSCSSILDLLERIKFGFTTTTPSRAAITEMWLNNASIHFLQITCWKKFLGMFSKTKSSQCLSVNMFNMEIPLEFVINLNSQIIFIRRSCKHVRLVVYRYEYK